jgi:putative PIN family toxin of toxin-antitoxin system
MSANAPGVVFDAVVFLQAMINEHGPAFVCWRLVREGKLALFVTSAVLAEAEEVGNRPVLQQIQEPYLGERGSLLGRRAGSCCSSHDVPAVFSYPRDPDDEHYVNLAVAAGASYLVTRDKDLLDLMASDDFRQRFPNLTILDPVSLLRELAVQEKPTAEPNEEPNPASDNEKKHRALPDC